MSRSHISASNLQGGISALGEHWVFFPRGEAPQANSHFNVLMKSHTGHCWASSGEEEQPALSRAARTTRNRLLTRWAHLGEIHSWVKTHGRGSQAPQMPPWDFLLKPCIFKGGGGQGLGPFQMEGLTYDPQSLPYTLFTNIISPHPYSISLRCGPYFPFIDEEIKTLRNYTVDSEFNE